MHNSNRLSNQLQIRPQLRTSTMPKLESNSDSERCAYKEENGKSFLDEAILLTHAELDLQVVDGLKIDSTCHAEATNNAIKSIATLHPEVDEHCVTSYIKGEEQSHYVESEWPVKREDEDEQCTTDSHSDAKGEKSRCSDCKKAEVEVCINAASFIFDLFNVPYTVARKGARTLIKAMPWEAKVRLANIAAKYFTDPGNLRKIAKGVNIICEMLISTCGDIGTVISISFHQLSRKDYAIITANAAVSVSLSFVSAGTAMLICLGLKTKTIYEMSMSVVNMKNERDKHKDKNYREKHKLVQKNKFVGLLKNSDVKITLMKDTLKYVLIEKSSLDGEIEKENVEDCDVSDDAHDTDKPSLGGEREKNGGSERKEEYCDILEDAHDTGKPSLDEKDKKKVEDCDISFTTQLEDFDKLE
jgi:hypothetical protein